MDMFLTDVYLKAVRPEHAKDARLDTNAMLIHSAFCALPVLALLIAFVSTR